MSSPTQSSPSTLIEGVGDELVYAAIAVGIITLLVLAWMSTSVRPLWTGETMWLVQLRTSPNRSVIEVCKSCRVLATLLFVLLLLQLTQIDNTRAEQMTSGGVGPRVVRLTEASAAVQLASDGVGPSEAAETTLPSFSQNGLLVKRCLRE